MTLEQRPLGGTGIVVSCLGLGTVKFGRNQEVKYPEVFALPSDREITRLLEQARELGINFLDTAPAYGSSEQRLGRLLRDRQHWIIATKVGEVFLNGVSQFHFDADHVRASVERSLRNLDTDYLDVVLIHSNGDDLKILEQSECLEELLRLKDKGLIRAIGMSTKTTDGGKRAVELTDLAMVTLNLDYREEEIVIDYAVESGKGILIKKALNSGHATDAHASLRFAAGRKGVSSVIVGTITPQHLIDNVKALTI